MSKSQRTKGSSFERMVANDLSDRRVVKRSIGQARDVAVGRPEGRRKPLAIVSPQEKRR